MKEFEIIFEAVELIVERFGNAIHGQGAISVEFKFRWSFVDSVTW